MSTLSARSSVSRSSVLAVVVPAVLGVAAGLGVFTFGYGQGAAYLSNDPVACTNCHVMDAPFDAWVKSSHHGVATCNDCHLSHDPLGKWFTKADNGFFHSLAFTTGDFPDPIRIKPRNRRVAVAACLHCHEALVHEIAFMGSGESPMDCTRCHEDVGHALH